MRLTGPALVAILLSAGCSRMYIPEGDPAAGRAAFESLQCYTCHRVSENGFPEPTAQPSVPVVLGNPENRKSQQYLAEAIIAPSHTFARPAPEVIQLDPPAYTQRQYENIQEGELSRMGDFSEAMTVRQWLDIVSYLESLQRGEQP